MNRQEQLLELENEVAKANKEIDNLKSGMTSGQMISVIFLLKFDKIASAELLDIQKASRTLS